MKINFIALSFMTGSSIQRFRQLGPKTRWLQPATRRLVPLAATLLGLLPLSATASTVEIYRTSSQGDRVTLKVKVLDDNRVPILGLKEENFRVETTNNRGRRITLEPPKISVLSPEESQPDPAYIIILLDMSGSMKHEDSGGVKKLDGAINAIREFINLAKADNLPAQISIVPFGEGGESCQYGYQVNEKNLEDNFLEATDSGLEKQLNELINVPVCASTNIYQPLAKAVSYLGKPNRFYQPASDINSEDKPPPKLAVILVSDGFHVSNRLNEQQQFQSLINVLKKNSQVTVHTLGYGESLSQLRHRAICSSSLLNEQLTVDNVSSYCRLRGADINEFIVDQPRLKEIAQATGGIDEFSADAKAVAESLKKFFTTLREYEIIYQQPGADRATIHTTKVFSNSSERGLNNLVSDDKNIRMGNFLYSSLPLSSRIGLFAFSILLGLAGLIPFMRWSQALKEQAESHL